MFDLSVIELLKKIQYGPIFYAVILVVVGFTLAKIISGFVKKTTKKRLSAQHSMLLTRIVFYFIFVLFIIAALQELGFDLGVLLGAAGILTVAIGFASQTSVSNIISGMFLIIEQPFVVGDEIKINNFSGEILSIDFLSVKLRTFDNTLVRIPNEKIIKAEVVNLSAFPIRRFDLNVGVAYSVDLEKVKSTILQVFNKVPECLDDPKPTIRITGFQDSDIGICISAWSTQSNFLKMRNRLYEEIKIAFDKNDIEMPFPQISINATDSIKPFVVSMHSPDK